MALVNSLYYPKGRDSITKLATIDGSVATAQELMTLPKDAVIIGLYILGAAAGTATRTVTVSGTTSTSVLNAFDLATYGSGYQPAGSAAGADLGVKLTSNVKLSATMSAADAGKTWILKVEYIVPGAGELL